MLLLHFVPVLAVLTVLALSDEIMTTTTTTNPWSRGFGDQHPWHPLEEGLALANQTRKTSMIIFHQSRCTVSKDLAAQFASLTTELSPYYSSLVFINVYNNHEGRMEEPRHWKFSPDGHYFPRVLFYDANGKLQRDLIAEEGNSAFKYFYYEIEVLLRTMKKAAALPPPRKKKPKKPKEEEIKLEAMEEEQLKVKVEEVKADEETRDEL